MAVLPRSLEQITATLNALPRYAAPRKGAILHCLRELEACMPPALAADLPPAVITRHMERLEAAQNVLRSDSYARHYDFRELENSISKSAVSNAYDDLRRGLEKLTLHAQQAGNETAEWAKAIDLAWTHVADQQSVLCNHRVVAAAPVFDARVTAVNAVSVPHSLMARGR